MSVFMNGGTWHALLAPDILQVVEPVASQERNADKILILMRNRTTLSTCSSCMFGPGSGLRKTTTPRIFLK